MGTLTPVPLPPEQVSLVTPRALPDIPSPNTPCAPACRPCFLFRAGLASDSPWWAIGGSSDFVHSQQSHQSHEAVSSSSRGVSCSLSSTDYPFTSSCSPPQVALTQLLSVAGGKLHQKGTFTLLVHVSSQAHCETRSGFDEYRVRVVTQGIASSEWPRSGTIHSRRCPGLLNRTPLEFIDR
jgi:hypothetical protein